MVDNRAPPSTSGVISKKLHVGCWVYKRGVFGWEMANSDYSPNQR